MNGLVREAVVALLESDSDRNFYNPSTGEVVVPDFRWDERGNAELNGFQVAEVPFEEAYREMSGSLSHFHGGWSYADVGMYALDALSAPGTGAGRRFALVEPGGYLFGELVDRILSQDGWGYGDRDHLEAYAQTDEGARALRGPTLYERLVQARITEEHPEWVSSHESDLYLVDNEATRPIVEKWCEDNGFSIAHQAPLFTDQVTGERTFDVFAAYDPYWEDRLSGKEGADIRPPEPPEKDRALETAGEWLPLGPEDMRTGAVYVSRIEGELSFVGIAQKAEDGTWAVQEYHTSPDRAGRLLDFEPVDGYEALDDALDAIEEAAARVSGDYLAPPAPARSQHAPRKASSAPAPAGDESLMRRTAQAIGGPACVKAKDRAARQ